MEGVIKVIWYIYPTCSPSNPPLHRTGYLKVVPHTFISCGIIALWPPKQICTLIKALHHERNTPRQVRHLWGSLNATTNPSRGAAWSQVRPAHSSLWSRGVEPLEPVICSSLPWWHLFGGLVQGKLHLLFGPRPAPRHRNHWELGITHTRTLEDSRCKPSHVWVCDFAFVLSVVNIAFYTHINKTAGAFFAFFFRFPNLQQWKNNQNPDASCTGLICIMQVILFCRPNMWG